MIGLRGLPNGAHSLSHPAGDLFVMVRRHKIVTAQLWHTHPLGYINWQAEPIGAQAGIRAGLQALAERVVMPAD